MATATIEFALLSNLEALAARVNEARRKIQSGELIILDDLLSDIEQAMPEAPALSETARGQIEPKLLALLDDINTLVQELEQQCGVTQQALEDASIRNRASIAYSNHQGTANTARKRS